MSIVDEAKLRSPICSRSFGYVITRSGVAVENWALFVDQCWLQALQFGTSHRFAEHPSQI